MMRRTTRALAVAAPMILTGAACAKSAAAVSGSDPARRYSAGQHGRVVRLHDRRRDTTVSIIPSAGNLAVELRVRGQNVLRFPHASPDEYTGRGSGSMGIPFLAPWADRLDEPAFYANGRRYPFDLGLGNIRGPNPIHGFLTTATEWQVTEVAADGTSAHVTSRLEFFRQPLWMKQFPFAHTIEMTHRLQDGVLEVTTRIRNLSAEPMPVAVGFHPYFQLTDSRRDEWTISVAARTHWPLGPGKMPTGKTQPIEAYFPDPRAVALKALDIDDVFSDLVRDRHGRAVMRVQGRSQKLDITLGPNYRAVVIYAPRPSAAPPGAPGQGGAGADRNFVCIEPVAAIINALNLAHRGEYRELQTLPPDGLWQESFWIRPSGF